MVKRIGVVLLWVLATVGTASVTLAAVSRVGSEVNDRPTAPISADALSSIPAANAGTASQPTSPEANTDPSSPGAGNSPDQVPTSDGAAPRDGEPTDPGAGSPVTTGAPSGAEQPTTTSTTEASGEGATTTSTSPGTTVPAANSSFTLTGGSVTVQLAGDQVTLVVANPAFNFKAEIKDSGPEKVVVEFKALDDSHESRFEAKVEGGELVVQTHEGSGEDDD